MTHNMNLILFTLIFCTFFYIQSILASIDDSKDKQFENARPCCDKGENKLKGRVCEGNYSISLNCKSGSKYILDPNTFPDDNFYIGGNEELLSHDFTTIMAPKDKYCITKNNVTYVAVVCFSEHPPETANELLSALICLNISVFFLVITFIIYCLVKDLRDLQGKCLMHMIANLAISYVVLGIIQTNNHLTEFWCITTAFILYISMMMTFLWLNVVSFNVWRLVRLKKVLQTSDTKLYYFYCLYAYGIMSVIFTITLILQHIEGDHLHPGIGIKRCWFLGTAEIWTFFYAPILVLLIVNMGFYIDSVYLLWTNYKNMAVSSTNSIKSHRFKCLLYIKLFIVMGLSWIFEPLSFLHSSSNADQGLFWKIADYINMLQGIFIFIILIATRKRALRGLAKMNFCGYRLCPIYFATLAPDDECEEMIQNFDEASLAPQPQNV